MIKRVFWQVYDSQELSRSFLRYNPLFLLEEYLLVEGYGASLERSLAELELKSIYLVTQSLATPMIFSVHVSQ